MSYSETIVEKNPEKGDEAMVRMGHNPDGTPWLEFFIIKRILGRRVSLNLGSGATLTVDSDEVEVVRSAKELKKR